MINCKVELKLTWTKHCVLSMLDVASTDSDDGVKSDSIIFNIKDKTYMFLSSFYQQNTTKNHQSFLAKGLKDQCIISV